MKLDTLVKQTVAGLVLLLQSGLAFGGAMPGRGTDAYVQKGLLAVWDGIENTGSSRQHSAEITEWKDVVGDRAFALTGVTITEDGLVFDGTGASSRGVLAEDDAAATFGKAGNGTMEIVLMPDTQTGQRVALQGPKVDSAGLAIGTLDARILLLQSEMSAQGISYDWRGVSNTFSVMYTLGSSIKCDFRNGERISAELYSGSDYWGSSDTCAYVGGRARGDNGFSGKICCVRLYDRHLDDDEIAANAEVDRIRYRERPSKDQIFIVGDPANYGSPTPTYGSHTLVSSDSLDFDVGEADLEDGETRMHCLGHRILRMDVNGGWEQEGEDSSATSFSYTHDGTAARKVEWIWKVLRPLAVGTPELVSARQLSAEFSIGVDGVGYDGFGARLSLAWGTSTLRLDQTNVVATVSEPCTCRAHLTRTKQVDYYVRSVLEKLDANGEVAAVAMSDIVCLSADKIVNEYVKDGLVAWWDGIYNGGSSRTFETSPNGWKDVVGNVAFSVHGYAPSATSDSMVFPGLEGVYGDLNAQDTEATFGKCASGTLEIVVRGNPNKAAIAVRGSDDSGIAFGPGTPQNGIMSFILHAGIAGSAVIAGQPTLPSEWTERSTFAVRYANKIPCSALVNGVGKWLSTDRIDYWGNNGDGEKAYVGNRALASASTSLDGEICAIRLYSRQLTDEEAKSNSQIDDIRFRGRMLHHDSLEIAGAPYEYGIVSPAYGYYSDLVSGMQIVCTAPAESQEGEMLATCTGWQLLTNAVDDASVWLPWQSGDGQTCAYVHEDGVVAKLVWQWQMSGGGGTLDIGTLSFGGVQADAMSVRVSVLGLGGADSGTLKLAWGCSPAALVNETMQTVSELGDVVFTLNGMLPNRRYFVQATLSAEGCDPVMSDIASCATLDEVDPQGTRERVLGAGMAYVASVIADGRPGDGVTVTGKVDFPDGAEDCSWHLLVWKHGESSVRRLPATDVEVDEEGNFSFTVVTDDPDSADYIQPERQYELAVETDLGNGHVSSSACNGFDTAASSRIDADSAKGSSRLRAITVNGRMLDVGAGGSSTLTLLVGDDEDSLAEVATTVVEADNMSFSLDYTVPTVERTYVWTVRSVNESAGRTVCWTNTLPLKSIFAYDSAHYVWTGDAGNGRWHDSGNWRVQYSPTNPTPVDPDDCLGVPNAIYASVAFPAETAVLVILDRDATIEGFSMNIAGSDVTLKSADGCTLDLMTRLLLSNGLKTCEPMARLTFDGVKVAAKSDAVIQNGCQIILRHRAELSCEIYRQSFDNGAFNGGTGTNLVIVGEGCKINTRRNFMLASGATCVVSNGTLDVAGELFFNCETDGGTLRLEGDQPRVIANGGCRSTNEPRQLTASGGIVFDIPQGGYQSAPIVIQSATSPFGGTDAQACQPLHVNVVMKSGAYRNPKTAVYPLLSTAGTINMARQTFGELKRPQTSAFVYAEAADKPVWQTRDELLPTAAPQLFGVRLGGAGGLVIFLGSCRSL